MTRRRALLLTVLTPPLCGVLVASLVASAWLVLGRPLEAGATWLTVTKVDPQNTAQFQQFPPGVHFYVVLGNDARDPSAVGLGDAIKVIAVNTDVGAASIINIPRDTSIGNGKINANSSTGGLAEMVDALSGFVGVPISFAMTANFAQFINLVNAMGGVDINIPQEMHDEHSGADFAAGPAHLDGDQALAFSRDRYSFGQGDIQRTQNQGLLIIAALQTMQTRADEWWPGARRARRRSPSTSCSRTRTSSTSTASGGGCSPSTRRTSRTSSSRPVEAAARTSRPAPAPTRCSPTSATTGSSRTTEASARGAGTLRRSEPGPERPGAEGAGSGKY